MDLSELLDNAGENNRIAQQQVYDLFAKPMFLVCRLYTKDDVTAEEILINGFLRFFRRLSGFRYINESATHNFLKRIMINECLRHLKRNRDLFIVAAEELPEGEWPEEITAQLGAKEIYVVIAKLPLGYRTVFNLVAMENKTHREVAAALNISEKTSQSQYRRAKDMLQQMLIQTNKDYECRKRKYNKGQAE
jgi:RNA polymerase sigma-70 factor (ECF subfamily)